MSKLVGFDTHKNQDDCLGRVFRHDSPYFRNLGIQSYALRHVTQVFKSAQTQTVWFVDSLAALASWEPDRVIILSTVYLSSTFEQDTIWFSGSFTATSIRVQELLERSRGQAHQHGSCFRYPSPLAVRV